MPAYAGFHVKLSLMVLSLYKLHCGNIFQYSLKCVDREWNCTLMMKSEDAQDAHTLLHRILVSQFLTSIRQLKFDIQNCQMLCFTGSIYLMLHGPNQSCVHSYGQTQFLCVRPWSDISSISVWF
jgi:hypothetical protein